MGVGVPPEVTSRLFQEFAYDGGLMNPTGSGLGLFICKNLITLMGGNIGYIQGPDRGSIFYFDLPSKQGAQKVQSAQTIQEVQAAQSVRMDQMDQIESVV